VHISAALFHIEGASMGWFVAVLLLMAAVAIGNGIHDGDFGLIAAGTFFFALPAVIIIYFKMRWLLPASSSSSITQADIQAEEERVRQLAPPRPAMTVPSPGNISVAFHQTDDAVWVWINLSETTKHILSDAKALETPVDEFHLDGTSSILRKMLNDIDDTPEMLHYTKRDKEDEKRQRIEEWNRPQYITLREILANPFRHYETNPQRRLEYLDKLKTKILPKVKTIIEGHSRPKTESFEL
jgi:hypothetical protein